MRELPHQVVLSKAQSRGDGSGSQGFVAGTARVSIAVPVMEKERFAELSGLSVDTVRGMIERDQIPTVKIGKRRLINVLKMSNDLLPLEGINALSE